MTDSEYPSYPRSNTIVFGLFLIYVLYRYLELGVRISLLGAIRFELILGSLLVLFALPSMFSDKGKADTTLYRWAILLILCMSVMVVFSADTAHSTDIFIDRVIKFSMFSVMITSFVKSPRELKWFIGAFMLACMKMGQEGFLGTITGSMIWYNQGIPRLHGPTPIYAHPNSFSGMAIGTLPFILYLFPIVSKWFKLALLAQSAFVLDIVLFTGSRTGYVAFAAGLGLLIKRSKKKLRVMVLLLVAALITIPLIPKDYMDRFDTIFTKHEKEGASTEKRIQILADAWAIFKEYPLGVGVGAFPIVREEKFGRTQDTHNLYFEVATNLGIQGFVIFLGLIVAMQKTLNTIRINTEEQIARVKAAEGQDSGQDPAIVQEHLSDLHWLKAIAQATYMFIFLRLALGLFGMDLFEIYWWFSLGITLALLNMELCARRRTDILTGATAKKKPARDFHASQGYRYG